MGDLCNYFLPCAQSKFATAQFSLAAHKLFKFCFGVYLYSFVDSVLVFPALLRLSTIFEFVTCDEEVALTCNTSQKSTTFVSDEILHALAGNTLEISCDRKRESIEQIIPDVFGSEARLLLRLLLLDNRFTDGLIALDKLADAFFASFTWGVQDHFFELIHVDVIKI